MRESFKRQFTEKRNIIWIVIYIFVSAIAVFTSLVDQKLYDDRNIIWSAGYLGITVLKSFAIATPVGIIIYILTNALRKFIASRAVREDENRNIPCWIIGIVTFVFIVVSRIPAFLAYYPGICTYDTVPQIYQIMSGEFNEHHPIIHTLFVRGCIYIGRVICRSETVGIAIYTVLQTIFISASMSYAIAIVYEVLAKCRLFGQKTVYAFISTITICMMFFPYNHYMALSLTKDSIFSAFFLVMIVSLTYSIYTNEGSNRIKDSKKVKLTDIVYFISSLGAVIFRNNAKYALLVLIIVCAVAALVKRKKWLIKIMTLSVAAVVAGMILMWGAARIVNAQPGDKREMLSVPIQQMARTMIYHGGVGVLPEDDNTMSEEHKELIRDYMLNGSYVHYDPYISDSVKKSTNTSVVINKKGAFVRTYIGLLKRYPSEYINAFMSLNSGFLSVTDVSHAYVYQTEIKEGRGYVQTFWNEEYLNSCGIYKQSKNIELFNYMERWATENKYLDIPIFRFVFMPGIYFWIIVFMLLDYIRSRMYKNLIPICFILAYYVTMLLGPTVTMRYVFPIMIIVPYMFMMSIPRNWKSEDAKNS